jgi:hypothetical protein
MNLRILVFLIIFTSVVGKGKTPDKIKREECEKLEVCKYDPSENCVLRCLSENCYIQAYGNTPLEPTEIKPDALKIFNECTRLEEKELKKANKKHNNT